MLELGWELLCCLFCLVGVWVWGIDVVEFDFVWLWLGMLMGVLCLLVCCIVELVFGGVCLLWMVLLCIINGWFVLGGVFCFWWFCFGLRFVKFGGGGVCIWGCIWGCMIGCCRKGGGKCYVGLLLMFYIVGVIWGICVIGW